MDDLSTLTDEELERRQQRDRAEAERRRMLREMPAQVAQLLEQYQAALGRSGGDQWEKPATVMDSYPYGAVVTHGGALHESLVHMNMAEPGKDVEAWSAVQDGEIE